MDRTGVFWGICIRNWWGVVTIFGACLNSCFKTRFKQELSCMQSPQPSCYSNSCFCLLNNPSDIFSADFSADSDTFSADFSNSNFLEYKNQIYIRVTTCNRFEINIHKTTSSTIHQVKLHHILTVNARIISISVMICLGFP